MRELGQGAVRRRLAAPAETRVRRRCIGRASRVVARGEPLMWAKEVTKTHDGERLLFEQLNLTISRGDRVALVGPNGCGKSSLMRVLAGKDTLVDAGEVRTKKGALIHFLEQEPVLAPDLAVVDAILASDLPVMRCVREYNAALKEAGGENGQRRLEKALLEMERLDAWTTEEKVRAMLDRLGCNPFIERECGVLSGGQRKRVALAAAMLQKPDVLLLDEPTNHLSAAGVEYLEEALQAEQDTALLLVTHDRAFLDNVCSDVLELNGRGGTYMHSGGGYAGYLEGREARLHAEAGVAADAKTVLRKESEWMAKQPQGRQTKSASRQERFYELKEQAKLGVEMGSIASLDLASTRLGKEVVALEDVSLAFGDEAVILRDFSYTFHRGERVAIVGANGAGKTTFLRSVMGEQEIDSGKIVVGETVKFGWYEQEATFENVDETVYDHVDAINRAARQRKNSTTAPTSGGLSTADDVTLAGGGGGGGGGSGGGGSGAGVGELNTYSLLERFQFTRGRMYTPIRKLSGGERRRLQLMRVLAARPNFLVLDEPTNDLDLSTIEVLEEMLQSYDGVVAIVSHDRAFVDNLAQHVLVFEGGGVVTDFIGKYSELRKRLRAESLSTGAAAEAAPATRAGEAAAPAAAAAAESDASAGEVSPADERARRRAVHNAPKRLEKIEKELARAEAALAEIDGALLAAGADAEECLKLAQNQTELQAKIEALYIDFEETEQLLLSSA